MCGIAGFWGEGGREHITAMTQALFHRGPDAGDVWVADDAPMHLGHRRLSIVDLATGHQPMRDAATGATIAYNGELYNHAELRRELEALGHRFMTSHSDTETVLRAFLQWGTACLERFNGMFAFAIYLPAKRELWLARDRFGEKPLFYTHNNHGFAFASEICGLAQWPYFDAGLDPANVQRFFAWGYMPGGRTVHPGCHGLQPGGWLRFDCAADSVATGRYWEFALEPDDSLTDADEPRLVEELRALLVQSVRRRLQSDVPLGIFLSGGIDSSAVLAATSQIVPPDRIQAFTIGFTEASFDESPNAREVANHFGVQHHVSVLTQDDMLREAPQVLARMSEPLGDASLIPTAKLAAFTRQHVTVALSGDGGDELFAGYDPLAALAPAALYRRCMPRPLHGLLRRAVDLLPVSDRNMSLEFKLKRVLRGLSWPRAMQLPVWMSPLEPAEIADCFANPLPAEELYADALALWAKHEKGTDDLGQALLFFTRFYLGDDILVKADRASMMVSLESRAVFLDNDIAAFCSRLPNRFKYRNGVRKYLLRKALADWLPERILNLPKKGFGIPLNRWLRHLPEPSAAVPGLHAATVGHYVTSHRERKGDCRLFLWALHALGSMDTSGTPRDTR